MPRLTSQHLYSLALRRDAEAAKVETDARRMRTASDCEALTRIASELRSRASRILERAVRHEELEERGFVPR